MPKTDEIRMPSVAAFHFETAVRGEKDGIIISADLPDWDPEEVVVRRLAREYGVSTMGELAEAMLRDGRARVEPGRNERYYRWETGDRV